jgi:hypothetical protein
MVKMFNVDYIFQYFEICDEDIRMELDNEDWNSLPNAPIRYFNMMNMFKTTNLQKKNVNKNDIYEYFVYFESSQEDTQVTMLDVYGRGFKTTNSILYLINFVYESIKLLNIFDSSLTETIIFQFSKLVITFVNICKNTIIEGEGYKRGRLKTISQKEISILCANMNIIRGIVNVLMDNITQEDLHQSLSNILKNTQLVINNSKQRISELFIQMYLHII